MSLETAERKGLEAVIAATGETRVLLTHRGHIVAVVDSAERQEANARQVREARLVILEAATNLVSSRSARFNLDDICSHLGLDASEVRDRSAVRAPDNFNA